jgi:2-methylcitrate dehydratase PrpD
MYPTAWPARVRLTLNDGTVLKGSADHALGNPENSVTTERLELKYHALVSPRFLGAAAQNGLAAVRSLRAQRDMATLVRDLAPPT